MKEFIVSVPFTGVCYVPINVSDNASKEDIIDAAFNSENLHLGDDADFEWEPHESICTGNILHAQQNEIDWEEV